MGSAVAASSQSRGPQSTVSVVTARPSPLCLNRKQFLGYLVMGSYTSKNKLSVEDMTFLQAKTQLDQASIQGWYEGFLKDCPSGELTKEQFVEMYSKIFPSGNADNFSKNIFRKFMLALHATSSGTPEEKLAWAFRMYDVDGNGSIEFNEMKRVVSAVYEMMGTESSNMSKAQELFSKMDQNSDGLVSQEEFIAVCSKDSDFLRILQGKC